ncbi:hypothetical protein [Flavobacterium phycosphaerae]|uniref:hypothetical protein n=1 Tax=Flavobacterium phycosphaerae TaxID=2697515 RepID=UPI00138A1628|nr:hypothetical protein [Flavobacterium phycosphaerae]
MFAKRFIALVKIGVLLLLVSNFAVAKTVGPISDAQETKTVMLVKGKHALTKELLQPQVLTVRTGVEPTAKPMPAGYVAITSDDELTLAINAVGTTTILLQDVNRCQSVSLLLFPYHIFW